jgi:hypothetical protein
VTQFDSVKSTLDSGCFLLDSDRIETLTLHLG